MIPSWSNMTLQSAFTLHFNNEVMNGSSFPVTIRAAALKQSVLGTHSTHGGRIYALDYYFKPYSYKPM